MLRNKEPEQNAPGPHTAIIVSRETTRYAVRLDGFRGLAPLYYVDYKYIIGVQ